MRWTIIILLLIIGAVGFWFYRSRSQQKTYTYASVSREDIEQTIEVPGKVNSSIKAQLKFLGGGKLTAIGVKEGMYVAKGAMVARIDARDLQKSLQSSLLDYSSTRIDFDQGIDDRADSDPNTALLRTAQKLQYTLDKSVVAVELKDIALKNASLYSPIAGVATAVPVDTVGVQVIATDTFEIVDPNSLYFEAEVDEADVGSVVEGSAVRIALDSYPNEPVDGTISTIGLKARSSSKSSGGTIFPIKVFLPNASIKKFRLGMNGTMTIILAKKDKVLTIPLEATTQTDGKITVKVKSTKVPAGEIKEIKTGIEGTSRVEVVSGLNEGDEVVLP